MDLKLSITIHPADTALVGIDRLALAVRRIGRGGPFTVADVCKAVRSQRQHLVSQYLQQLAAEGVVREKGFAGAGVARNRQFELTGEGEPLGEPATRIGRVRQNIWNVLRVRGRDPMTTDEVVMLAATEDVRITPSEAGSYLNALAEAGYVSADTGRRPKRYQFLQRQDSGPAAPQIFALEIVFDPNRQTIATPSVVAREAGR